MSKLNNMYFLICAFKLEIAIWVGWLLLWAKFGFLGWTSEPWDCWASKSSFEPSLTSLDNSYVNVAQRFRDLCLYAFFSSFVFPFTNCIYAIGIPIACVRPLAILNNLLLPVASLVWIILLGMWTFGH